MGREVLPIATAEDLDAPTERALHEPGICASRKQVLSGCVVLVAVAHQDHAVFRAGLSEEVGRGVPDNAVPVVEESEPEIGRLSNILKTFNENFGTLFTDVEK
ncbi:MAG: hypothetical protein ABSF43_02685 [Rectinemataceae bacterium]|jgi:hypothetical protein